MSEQVYVTKDWLNALLPDWRELMAQLVWMPALMILATQLLFWFSRVARTSFTLKVIVISAVCFVLAFPVWFVLFRRRLDILRRERELMASINCVEGTARNGLDTRTRA